MPDNSPTADQYWLLTSDVPTGPFTVADIHAKLASGGATWQTKACMIGGTKWVPLVQTPGIGPTATVEGSASVVAANEPRVATVPAVPPPTAPLPSPPTADPRAFRFRNGLTATDLAGFLQTCRDSPRTAAAQLRDGEFGPWLTAIGEHVLAAFAGTARTHSSSDDECLRFFLAQADPAKSGASTGQSGSPSPARVIVAVLVLGLMAWGVYELLRPLNPMEVCKKWDEAKSATEAKKYATARMHPVMDAIEAENTTTDPNNDFEVGREVDGPDSNTKLIGFRGTWFIQEQGKRVRVEGHVRVVQSDGWKVDDMVFTGVEGVSLPAPFSIVDEHRRSVTPPKGTAPTPTSPKTATTPGSGERKKSPVETAFFRVKDSIGWGGIVVLIVLFVVGRTIYEESQKKPKQP
ncbi:MAG: hypothetical protein C0467_32270 [Planctomycetaceae bacterium]|nr:hypothetical protein [Planctomycetaceae bacterium]